MNNWKENNISRNNKRKERIGSIFNNSHGRKYVVTEYKSAHDVLVEFECGFSVKVEWKAARQGYISHPLDKTVYGVGVLGFGEFTSNSFDGKLYGTWQRMLRRCYGDQNKETYIGVTVCDEWHNFQNFCGWAVEQEGFQEDSWHLDKDLLSGTNQKIYSPDTCCFLPIEINMVIQGKKSDNGLPQGVVLDKRRSLYFSSAIKGEDNKFLGYSKNPEECFAKYKHAKEKIVKDIAFKWKDKISNVAYDALLKFEVQS